MTISDNGHYFQLFRKLDTKDRMDAVLTCGTTHTLDWLGKTVFTNIAYDKEGTYKLKLTEDCEIVDAGATNLLIKAITAVAMLSATLY